MRCHHSDFFAFIYWSKNFSTELPFKKQWPLWCYKTVRPLDNSYHHITRTQKCSCHISNEIEPQCQALQKQEQAKHRGACIWWLKSVGWQISQKDGNRLIERLDWEGQHHTIDKLIDKNISPQYSFMDDFQYILTFLGKSNFL